MKILLLGASGQLGKEWQHIVNQRDTAAGDHLLIPYTHDKLDITNSGQLRNELQEQQPDVVVNCAAYTDVDGAETQKTLAHQVNGEAVLSVAALCAEIGCKLVYYSTDYVFPGKKEDRQKLPDGYPENYPPDPVNWYGKTKWEGEKAIRNQTENHLIIRTSWLCGRFGTNFVKTMLELGRERDQLQVVNDQWGSPAFAENIVTNTLQLLHSEMRGTYHITSKGQITWYDFARSIFTLSNVDVDVKPVSSEAFQTEARRPYFSKLSTKKIESVPGSEVIEWEEGLRKLLNQI